MIQSKFTRGDAGTVGTGNYQLTQHIFDLRYYHSDTYGTGISITEKSGETLKYGTGTG